MVDWLVKVASEGKGGERGGEIVHGTVERIAEVKFRDAAGKRIHGLVEIGGRSVLISHESEVAEGLGEFVDGMVEKDAKCEVGEDWRAIC